MVKLDLGRERFYNRSYTVVFLWDIEQTDALVLKTKLDVLKFSCSVQTDNKNWFRCYQEGLTILILKVFNALLLSNVSSRMGITANCESAILVA